MKRIMFVMLICFAVVSCNQEVKEESNMLSSSETFVQIAEVDLGHTPEVGKVIFSIPDVLRVYVVEYDHPERYLKLGFTYIVDEVPISFEEKVFNSAPFSWHSFNNGEQSSRSVNIFANWNLEGEVGYQHVVVKVEYRKFKSTISHL